MKAEQIFLRGSIVIITSTFYKTMNLFFDGVARHETMQSIISETKFPQPKTP